MKTYRICAAILVGLVAACVGSSVWAASLIVSGNVTNPTPNPFTGGTWGSGAITLTNVGAGAYVLTNSSGTFVLTNAAQSQINGGGTFLNQGTFQILQANPTDNYGVALVGAGTTFENQGILDINRGSTASTNAINLGLGATLRMRAASTLQYDANYRTTFGPAIVGAGVVTTTTNGGIVGVNSEAINITLVSGTNSFNNTGASDIRIGALTLPTGAALQQNNGAGNTYTWSGSFDGANALGSFVLSSGTFKLGDTINLNLGQDFVVAGAATIDLNGFSLTNAVGRTLTNKNVAATITSTSAGNGTLVNNGVLWGGTSGLTITNATIDTFGTNTLPGGTWTLQGGSPGILLLRSNSLLRATTTATITGNGQITNTGPANLEVDGGKLTISTTNSAGFNVNSLVISNGATLQFDSSVGSIYGWQGSMTAAGNITFNGSGGNGTPWATLRLDGDVDASLGQGLTFNPSQNNGPGGIIFNGHNFTNEAGSTVSFVASATRIASMSSTSPAAFVNKGNLTLTPGQLTVSITNVTVDNSGTLNVGAVLNLLGGTNTILLLRSNSTVRGNNTTASITGGKILSDTNAVTGAPLPVNLQVDAGAFTITPAAGNSLSLSVNSLVISNGATLTFAGTGVNVGWRGSMTAAGILAFGNGASALTGSYLSLEGDVDVNLGQGLTINDAQNAPTLFTGGGIHFNGHNLTNAAGSTVNIVVGGGFRSADFSSTGSPGSLINYGTLTIPGGSLNFNMTNVTVANHGTVNLANTMSMGAGGVLENEVNGTLLNAGGTARITGLSSGAFRNYGTVSIATNSLQIDTVDCSQWYSGGWLLDGTWRVSGGTLKLNPGGAITNIGANATVFFEGGSIQSGSGYVFLGNTLTNVAGRFFVNNTTNSTTVYTSTPPLYVTGTLGGSGVITASVITVQSGGTLAPGNTNSVGTLTLNGAVAFQSGAKYAMDYSGTTNDTVVVNGTLTVPATATVAVTNLAAGAPSKQMVLFSATTLNAPGSLKGWTVTGPADVAKYRYRATVQGTQVILVPEQGTSFLMR